MSVLLTVQVCLDTPNLGDKTVNRISDIDVGTIPKGGQVRDLKNHHWTNFLRPDSCFKDIILQI